MHNGKTISLIPYLSPAHGFCLAVDRCGTEGAAPGETPCKFEELVDSFSFGRLMSARIVCAGNRQVKKVFLLMQKDVYWHPTDEIRPLTNPMIEGIWQRAFKLYADNEQHPTGFTLTGPSDAEAAWQSLFFCHLRQLYFHPPCPVCGHALHLCRDDKILTGMGLRPFTTSLKRYLYCSFCHEVAGQSDFFTYELTDSDPSFVNDRWDLIRKLGRLQPGPEIPDFFPCPDCLERENCHKPDGPAKNRIGILNFYPSYMMVFPGRAINAIDFLALVSGASGEQLQQYLSDTHQEGRMKCLHASGVLQDKGPYFLFRHSNRFFLEVLYLKLNFLAGVTQSILPALKNLRPPDLGFSLDRFWVKPAGRTGLIPSFWNFTVHRIDLGDVASRPLELPQNVPSYGFYFLGTIWFFTLLANSRQASSMIYEKLQTVLESERDTAVPHGDEFETVLKSPVFAPDNIFWNSGEGEVPESVLTLWQETLKTGWLLLKSAQHASGKHPLEDFQKKMTTLLETVNGMLLPLTGSAEASGEKTSRKELSNQDKLAIGRILNRITRKWSLTAEQDPLAPDLFEKAPFTDKLAAPEAGPDASDVDLDATLIMGNEHGHTPPAATDHNGPTAPILEKKSGFTIKATGLPEEKPICETVMLSSGIFNNTGNDKTGYEKKALESLSEPSNAGHPIDFFEDHTIIQKPEVPPEKPMHTHVPELPCVDGLTGSDEMAETLVLSPADKKNRSWSPEDDFAETMIQTPGASDTQNTARGSLKQDPWPPDMMKKTEKIPARKNDHAGDDLAETVILNSGPKTGIRK